MYISILNVLTPKISINHKNNQICNVHTLGDTFGLLLVHFTPLSYKESLNILILRSSGLVI